MANHSRILATRMQWRLWKGKRLEDEPPGQKVCNMLLRKSGEQLLIAPERLSKFTFTFHFHALEKEMATHSSVLAWRIPGPEEPGGLPSTGLHGVGHDWRDITAATARQNEVQFSSISQSCLTHCDPMNRSTPGLPVHHQLPESTQTHVHWVSDVIQTSHPLSFSSCPQSFPASGSFLCSSSHLVAKVLEFQLQHQSFQWTSRTDLL